MLKRYRDTQTHGSRGGSDSNSFRKREILLLNKMRHHFLPVALMRMRSNRHEAEWDPLLWRDSLAKSVKICSAFSDTTISFLGRHSTILTCLRFLVHVFPENFVPAPAGPSAWGALSSCSRGKSIPGRRDRTCRGPEPGPYLTGEQLRRSG